MRRQAHSSTGESRVRALQKTEPREVRSKNVPQDTSVSKLAAIQAAVQGTIADRSSKRLREEVHANIKGFLDIDKIIEHRKPLDKLAKRPGIPQVVVTSANKDTGPQYKSLRCAECNALITASMYSQHSQDRNGHTKTVCESCYWSRHYGDESFTKSYKHSVSTDGLSEREAEAKYAGLLGSVGDVPRDQKSSLSRSFSRAGEKLKARRLSATAKGNMPASSEGQPKPPQGAALDVLATEDEDIPLFFRQCMERNPFAEVHMALRIGPLVIENGVSNTHAGALVSLRDLPIFIERFHIRGSHQRALSIGTDVERRVWEHQRVVRTPKHYKVIIKQVVGAPFSGALSRFIESDQEQQVLKLVIKASEHDFDSPALFPADQKRKLDECLNPILESLKDLLQSRLRVYLHRIVQTLLDPHNILTWNPLDNNCRAFCDSLLDHTLYGPLVNGPHQTIQGSSPLYLMSFVSPTQKGYMKPQLRSKFDVPEGFIEEYMRRLYFGRHNDADILDSLQEYWYDWGGFSKPLYKHQDMFPWDCSEAYKGSEGECGQCNLSKHVWRFPFDSWSIVTLHLQRDQYQYPGFANLANPAKLKQWTKSRLSLLQASSKLNRVAAAMSLSTTFVKLATWLHETDRGLLQSHPSLSRVRNGGIHRAQPCSHYYDVGVGRNYFLAEWAAMDEEKQKQEYEKLRDARMRAEDIPAAVALQVPKFSTISQRHGTLAFHGFQGAFQNDTLLTEVKTSYYPYFHAVLSHDPSEGGWECADAQLYRLDEIAGDGNLTKGAEYNCGSGCGSASKADVLPRVQWTAYKPTTSASRPRAKNRYKSSTYSYGGSSGCTGSGYGGSGCGSGGGGSGGGGGGGSGGGG
ncbi:hypothetical protein BJX96DRAFT_185608 [Aspergillus floccosus]